MAHPNTTLAEIGVLPFEGDRYEAGVPDTLNLVERAELAIHAITSMLDPDRDYLMYSHSEFSRRPPVVTFSGVSGSVGCCSKHLEALPLLRVMSGSSLNMEADAKFMASMLHMTGEDGCIYTPKEKGLHPMYPPDLQEPFADLRGDGREQGA